MHRRTSHLTTWRLRASVQNDRRSCCGRRRPSAAHTQDNAQSKRDSSRNSAMSQAVPLWAAFVRVTLLFPAIRAKRQRRRQRLTAALPQLPLTQHLPQTVGVAIGALESSHQQSTTAKTTQKTVRASMTTVKSDSIHRSHHHRTPQILWTTSRRFALPETAALPQLNPLQAMEEIVFPHSLKSNPRATRSSSCRMRCFRPAKRARL
jgi:hypothetical protein